MKVVRLSAKHTVQRDIPDTHSCYSLSRTQDNMTAGRIKSIQWTHR